MSEPVATGDKSPKDKMKIGIHRTRRFSGMTVKIERAHLNYAIRSICDIEDEEKKKLLKEQLLKLVEKYYDYDELNVRHILGYLRTVASEDNLEELYYDLLEVNKAVYPDEEVLEITIP
jgi:hypothetical protein